MEAPRRAFAVSDDGRRARLRIRDLPVIDSFVILGADTTPAVVNLDIEWTPTEEPQRRGQGASVDDTDPAAFTGDFATAEATGSFWGSQLGFAFRSDDEATTEAGFAEFGTQRNGVYLAG